MPKVTYKQNFRDSWLNFEEFKQWLRKAPTDSTKAYCCFCKVSIGAKLFEIRQHAQAKKHIACIASVAQNHTIHFGRQPTKTEEQEVALCLYIAEHSAIAPIDHLSQLCVKQFKACDATVDIKLKRTKCTHIINDVLGVHFEDDLRKDIGKSKFSLLLDESTDISVTKLLDDLEDCAVNDLYMGYAFEKEIKDEKYFDEKYKIREDCKNFIKALIIQLRERLPDNIEVLKQMDIFAVGNMLQANKTPDKIISLLEHQYENIDEIVSQFGKNPPY
ncbi:uncharacterized protein LOC128263691 isoform X5 [Drosophila gunungcola]|uniref:uncharacterized protein LOC128263691 isoform X5 n=1 Tax=Drosophila gunungcola TaxID=103775 RepID=UPI0022E12040|nr:uncharacterized protein LOC128263691 isoform X5 [Drosophila gunungcola]